MPSIIIGCGGTDFCRFERRLDQVGDVVRRHLHLVVKQVARQRVAELARGLKAVGRVSLVSACIRRLELWVDLRVIADQARDLGARHRLDGFIVGIAQEQSAARQHLPEAHAEREDVRSLVDRLSRLPTSGDR